MPCGRFQTELFVLMVSFGWWTCGIVRLLCGASSLLHVGAVYWPGAQCRGKAPVWGVTEARFWVVLMRWTLADCLALGAGPRQLAGAPMDPVSVSILAREASRPKGNCKP